MSDIPQEHSRLNYMSAVFVAFIMSTFTCVVFALISVSTRMTSDSFPTLYVVFNLGFNLLAGFNGVFFGSLCLRRSERVFGAVGLLVLGICLEFLLFGSGHGGFRFPFGVIASGAGGLLAVGCHLWRRPSEPGR